MNRANGPTKAKIARALDAAIAAGLIISRYEVGNNGEIIVHIASENNDGNRTPLDEWKARREAR